MNLQSTTPPEETVLNEVANATDALHEKLADALIPGYQVEFDPDEAERAGAFIEDALSEHDATESNVDLLAATLPVVGEKE